MKLMHKAIPVHFLQALPEGIKFLKKNNQGFLVVENLFCPMGHDLMAEVVRIHGEPSIKIKLKIGNSEGLVFIDAFWGGHAKLYNFIPDVASAGSLVKAHCPDCDADLTVEDKCSQEGCDSGRAILFYLKGKANKIYVCAKLGCPGHRMEIKHVSHQVLEKVSEINYFGAQADDIFMEI